MSKKVEFHKVGMTPSQASEAHSSMIGAASTLWQLEALFKAISKQSEHASEIKQLAGIRAYVACDIANLTDCMIEDLETGGIA